MGSFLNVALLQAPHDPVQELASSFGHNERTVIDLGRQFVHVFNVSGDGGVLVIKGGGPFSVAKGMRQMR